MKKRIECHKADYMCTVMRRTAGREKRVEAKLRGSGVCRAAMMTERCFYFFLGCANER